MRRDMEFVRELLIGFSRGESKTHFNASKEEDKVYIYHLKILKEAGLIDFKESNFKGGMVLYDVPTLTWFGNDYLDSISNDSVWSRTKEGIKSKGLELWSVPFDVLKEYAKLQLKQQIGLE